MTKKDFVAIAQIIKENSHDLIVNYSTNWDGWRNDMVDGFADYFATQNPNFDRDKFIKACCT